LPIDVFSIAKAYADVEFQSLPRTIDGFAVHRLHGKRSKIAINKDTSPARQRFTAAHELGHILIPWHSGMSVDTFDAALAGDEPFGADDEGEANRFAAELLLPASQVRTALRSSSMGKGILQMRKTAEVSLEVACLAAVAHSPETHLLVVVDGVSRIIAAYRSSASWISRPAIGSRMETPSTFFAPFQPEVQIARVSPYEDSRTLYAWTIDSDSLWKTAGRTGDWRSTLAEIIASLPNAEEKRGLRESFSGMAGSANNLVQRNSLSFKRRFELLLHRAISNATVARMASHEKFPTLLAQRARSLRPR